MSERVSEQAAQADVGGGLTDFLVRNIWVLVVPVVLPLSALYRLYWTARHVYYRRMRNAAAEHDQRVRQIVGQLDAWDRAGRPGKLHTSRKAWQSVTVRPVQYKRGSRSGIDVNLYDTLSIDTERRIARVEPRVNIAQLTRWLIPKGWTIPVVGELDDLTISGLILGYGIESSSHRYGLFANTVRAAELVLADGSVVTTSPTENSDLFHALPWSYGAHGFLTAIELPIIPCKPYVRLTYEPVRGLNAICTRFTELVCAEHPPEFIDALLYDLDRAVIVHGAFADLPAGVRPNRIGRYYKPWFYKHMEAFLHLGQASEYVRLRDYYLRYTRSLFWHGELLVPFGNHPLFRYPLGWLMPPKPSLMRLTQSERVRIYREERNFLQDGLVPIRLLREGIELFHRECECYPLWLCPHLNVRTSPSGMIAPSRPELDQEMYVDIGAWQVPRPVKRREPWSGPPAVQRVEAWLREHSGYQCLYAVTEQTRSEFWQMFDRTLYDVVREKYQAAGAFMDVYDKVKRPEQA
jgi:delta24-sterol reductase